MTTTTTTTTTKWHWISGCGFPLICHAVYPPSFIWFELQSSLKYNGTKISSEKLNSDNSLFSEIMSSTLTGRCETTHQKTILDLIQKGEIIMKTCNKEQK